MTRKEKSARWAQKSPERKHRIRKTLLIILGILVVIRLCLPFIILHFANKKLAALDGYYGHIDDIDLALIRGAYTIDDIFINKVNKKGEKIAEFFTCRQIDLSVEWRAIFDGKIVGEVEFASPVVNYTKAAEKKEAPTDTTDFIQVVKDFMPLDINHFAISNGSVHYIDPYSKPKVDVPMLDINVDGKGLTNEPIEGVTLPATIDMTAGLYDGGFSLGVKLDPLKKQPTFDLNAKLTETQLTHLNPFMQAYGNFDLKAGSLELFTEIAAKDGEFTGYVKPIVKDLDIVQFNKEEGNLRQIAWEAIVGSVAEIFQNQRKDQLATKVELNGKFNDPKINTWEAIIALLRNAFIKALEPSIENTINLQDVNEKEEEANKKGLFKRIFGKDEDEKESGEKDKKDAADKRKTKRKEK